MGLCSFDIETFKYNIESNLESMHMPTPTTVFGTATSVLGALKAVDEVLHLNSKASLTSTTITLGIGAAGWAGAVLGSAMMSANRSTRCDKREMKEIAKEYGLWGDWIDEAYNQLNW